MTHIVPGGKDHVNCVLLTHCVHKSISGSHLKGPNSSELYSESFNYLTIFLKTLSYMFDRILGTPV